MELLLSPAAELRRRALASRASRGAPPPLSPNELWPVVSAEAAEVQAAPVISFASLGKGVCVAGYSAKQVHGQFIL